ncbi:MAG: DNA repair protein RecN [Candidatus Azobacteroides sp.]|nr:DNA repair protein RecN [Candidatus Azobacteroides sp.]
MLTDLFIQNYALISRLEMQLGEGFYVLTGETGAGKSILIGALSLILGQRADIKTIKSNEDKCIIEASFNISAYQLQDFFEKNDIDYYEECILRREIHVSGKSRAFINDTPVSLTILKELASALIDIHSQHQNLLLSDNRFQMRVLDILSHNAGLLKDYGKAFTHYKFLQNQLREIIEQADKNKADEEYFRFQFEQLEAAKLSENEQESLEEEVATLTHAEEIKSGLYKIFQLLNREEAGVVSLLKDSTNIASSISKVYPAGEEILERLNSCYIDLKDLSDDLETRAERIEFEPERLQQITDRLNLIYSLQQKHRVSSIKELLEIELSLREKLHSIEYMDEDIEKLQKQIQEQLKETLSIAKKISGNRKKAATTLEKNLVERLAYLGMSNVKFHVEFTERETPNETGTDQVRFLFSANKSMPLHPVAETASGGEISRLMLCIKALIASATSLPTIIFDEIDTGVSGEIADKMGIIMEEMSRYMQVISITHLPQIAARGNGHFKVYKEEKDGKTYTNIKLLSQSERITEIAQMLSGAKITDAAISNAKVLLKIN